MAVLHESATYLLTPKDFKMKTLQQMDNLERAYLLARLFPDELQVMTQFIKKEAELFNRNREQVFNEWTEKNIDANRWYDFINNFERRYDKNGARLYRNKRTFRDQLFDGYDALFTIHCLIVYADSTFCNLKIKQAIHLFFGNHKFLAITFNN